MIGKDKMTKISWLGKSNVQIANVSRFNNKLMMMIFFLCHNKQHLGNFFCESWIMTCFCFAIGCKGCDDKQRWNKRSYIWKRLWQQVWILTKFLTTMIKPRYAWSMTKYLYSSQILYKEKSFRFKVPLCSFHHCFLIASFVAEPWSVWDCPWTSNELSCYTICYEKKELWRLES